MIRQARGMIPRQLLRPRVRGRRRGGCVVSQWIEAKGRPQQRRLSSKFLFNAHRLLGCLGRGRHGHGNGIGNQHRDLVFVNEEVVAVLESPMLQLRQRRVCVVQRNAILTRADDMEGAVDTTYGRVVSGNVGTA